MVLLATVIFNNSDKLIMILQAVS